MFKNRSFDLFFKIYFYLVSRWQLFSSTLNGLSLHVLHTLYVHLFAFTLRNKFSQSTCTTDLQRNNKKIKEHKQKSKKKKNFPSFTSSTPSCKDQCWVNALRQMLYFEREIFYFYTEGWWLKKLACQNMSNNSVLKFCFKEQFKQEVSHK